MKRIITVISAIVWLGGFTLQAAPVTPERAMEIGKRILSAQPATKAGTGEVRIVWNGEFPGEPATKAESPALYVVARDGGGFVIVAGDDNARPVLGLSYESPFKTENMPENVKWWMEGLKQYVRGSKTPSLETRQLWDALVSTKSALPGPFSGEFLGSRTCQWSQGDPANDLAPTVSGQDSKAVAGCLPLAMAEILTWHGWPYAGTGTKSYSYTSRNGQTVNVPAVGVYDVSTLTIPLGSSASDAGTWKALQSLDTYAKFLGCSGETRAKLSQLVYTCGVIVEAKYNSGTYGGTSAFSSNVVRAFGTHMGYNKGAYLDYLSNHTVREWVSLLKAEVSLRPVLYSGQSSSGSGNDSGHSYVLDGFATYYGDDVFHFNFGWGEWCNGYYYAAYQNTDEGYNYNRDLEALFDFYPVTGETSYPARLQAYCYDVDERFKGIRAIYNKEYSQYVIYYCIANRGSDAYNDELQFFVKRKNGTEEWLETVNFGVGAPDWEGRYGISRSGFYIPISNVSFGDKVICYYNDRGTWRLLSGPIASVMTGAPLMPAAFIKTGTYQVGDYFQFELTNNDYVYPGTKWTITDPGGNTTSAIPQSEREFKLTMSGTYKIQAVVAETVGGPVKETIVTYITVAP